MTAIIDTNVVIDVLRGNRDAVDVLRALISADDVAVSELTYLELLAGALQREQRALDQLMEAFVRLPVTDKVMERAGQLARRHAAAHRGIDAVDYVIAATAIEHDGQLVTRNVKDFPMFPRLRAPY
jgi:predicted nucleic acid-binding protein